MGNRQNAFETTLTAEFGPTALTAAVTSKGNLTTPCYLVLEPDSDTQREVIYFDGTFGANSFVTTNVVNRYLEGSAQTSGLTHASGAVVRSVPVTQEIDDLWTGIGNLDHGDFSGLSDNDHPQYLLTSGFTKAAIDAMNVDADTLDSLDSTAFSLAAHDHDSDYADIAHVGAGGAAHANVVSGGASGFMTGADKATLDTLESAGGGVASVLPGGGIDTSGTSVVTVSHEDTSSQGTVNNSGATVIQDVSLDTYGHVTSLGSKTLGAADVGAASSSHNHSGVYAVASHTSSSDHDGRYDSRYYIRATVDNALNLKANIASPNFTGTGGIRINNAYALDLSGGYIKVKYGSVEVMSGNGSNQFYIKGIPHNNVQYDVRCTDTGGGGRQLYYYDDSSTERAKTNIKISPLQGGECLTWDMYEFQKTLEGPSGPYHQWTIAERIQEKSGDSFVVRDSNGLIQNTDDRAMMADMILTIQQLNARIEELEVEA